MSRSITIGQYLPGHTLVHRLDSRSKLLSLVLFIAGIFLASTFYGLAFLLGLVLSLLGLSKIPYRYAIRGLRPILVIVILTLVMHIFFTKGGVVLLRLGAVTIESDGVHTGVFTALRLVVLILFTMLVTLTTTPLSLTGAMEFFLKPLRYLYFPVSEMAMIVMIALRFIPTLMEESQRIVRAQMARGARFGEGHLFRRARALVPVIIPLFAGAFRRADDLATAMEARCYRVGATRTSIREIRMSLADYAAVLFALSVTAGLLLTPF